MQHIWELFSLLLKEKKVVSPKESHLECLVVRNGFCSGFFLCKFDEVNKRLVSSLGTVVLNFAAVFQLLTVLF